MLDRRQFLLGTTAVAATAAMPAAAIDAGVRWATDSGPFVMGCFLRWQGESEVLRVLYGVESLDDMGLLNGGRVAGDCSAISCGVNRSTEAEPVRLWSNAGPETGVTGGESAAPNLPKSKVD